MLWDVKENPTPYMRVAIVSGLKFGMSNVAPGGFLLKQGLGYIITAIANSSPQQTALTAATEADMTWRYSTEIRASGDVAITNSYASTPIQVSGSTQSRALGAGSFVIVRGAENGAFSDVVPLFRFGNAIPLAIGLTPRPTATGVITSRTPRISLIWTSEAFNAIAPETMQIWVNGTRISSPLEKGSHQITPATRLRRGPNTIWATLGSLEGVMSEATLVVTATGTPTPPTGLQAFGGVSNVILRWSASPEPDLGGYQVLRATAAVGPFDLYASLPVTQTVFVDSAPLETGWYALVAIDPGGEASDRSTAVEATRSTAGTIPVPPAPVGFQTSSQNHAVLITFQDTNPATAAWRIQRAESVDGPFVDLPIGGSLLGAGTFHDTSAAIGGSYWYRLIPLSPDLEEGTPAISGPVLLVNSPPAAPTSIIAVYDHYRVTLHWNPSPDQDLVGYRIARSTHGGPFLPLTKTLVTTTEYTESVGWDTWYTYQVAAVDRSGTEGATCTSNTVTAFLSDNPPQIYIPFIQVGVR